MQLVKPGAFLAHRVEFISVYLRVESLIVW